LSILDRLKKKGFYIKKDKISNGLILNLYLPDFIEYITQHKDKADWVKLRLYERQSIDPKGFTHNMEAIQLNEKTLKADYE